MAEWERAGALARGSTMTELRYFVNYSDALHLTGRYADAVSQAMAGIELARERGLERSSGCMLAGNAAEPLMALGEWSRAYAMTERALELDPPAEPRRAPAAAPGLAADLARRAGRGRGHPPRVPADDHQGGPVPAAGRARRVSRRPDALHDRAGEVHGPTHAVLRQVLLRP